VGSAGPYRPQKTMVQMMAETVIIEVSDQPDTPTVGEPIHVKATFRMKNQGKKDESMQVIFPLSQVSAPTMEQAIYEVDPDSFTVMVNGRSVPTSQITTPSAEGYQLEYDKDYHRLQGFRSEVLWAAFDVAFPVQKPILLEVEYDMVSLSPWEFTSIVYILETGAGWYGTIQSADLILRLPYRADEDAIESANPGYTLVGKEMRWHIEDFEPTPKDNLTIRVLNASLWSHILELRSMVKQNAKDVQAWADLGNIYTNMAIYFREGHFYVHDGRYIEPAIEACQKVVDLQPESGEAHLKLAWILWFGNPGVIARFSWGETKPAPALQLDDPAIQRVLNELQLAKSYGVTSGLEYEIQSYIYRAFPELQPTPTITITATQAPPTDTTTVTATLPMPTITAMPEPADTQTPEPATKDSASLPGILKAAAILVVAGALLYFLWNLWKMRRQK
jgi:hypothetical protein